MRVEQLKLMPVSTVGGLDKLTGPQEGKLAFSDVLAKALDDVNSLQASAKEASMKLASGQIQDISEVVIASEKASIAIQLTMQVRNKAIDAYQEVMRMQV